MKGQLCVTDHKGKKKLTSIKISSCIKLLGRECFVTVTMTTLNRLNKN